MSLLKIKLTIAFDGGNYAGWQVQKIGTGVQEKIEEAIQKIFSRQIRLHSSSRTDQGVHARGMIAHFEIEKERLRMPINKIALALNAHLPEDIRIMQVARANLEFHARFNAKGKEYRYYIYNHHAMDPLLRWTAWHVPKKLDVELMREAAKYFVGTKDFSAFAASRGYKMESTIRTVTKCDLKKSGRLITISIRGDGFLYKMCRGIAGTLAQVGHGKFSPDEIPKMLEAKDRRMAGMTAPAHGLILWKVFY